MWVKLRVMKFDVQYTFPVPANLLLFVYLDVFLWFHFVWRNIYHFYKLLCRIIVIVYGNAVLKAIGNLDIDILVSPMTLQNFSFPLKNFFCKNNIWPIQLLCSFIWHQYHFALFTHSSMIFFWTIHGHSLVL